MNFKNFIGNNPKSTSKKNKALEFFTKLQYIKPLIQSYLKLKKQNRKWTVRMAIGSYL